MNDKLRLAIIIGSTRPGRFGPVPAKWIAARAGEHGAFDVDLVDLVEADVPMHMGDFSEAPHPHVDALGERLKAADGFIVVTPEYNHSYPAPLKAAIDHYQPEWHAKPVGFVSYGGMAGGQRAVEHLRQVFPEVHATTIRDTISFVNYGELFDDDGQLIDDTADKAAHGMLDQLVWWATALRTARQQQPYQG